MAGIEEVSPLISQFQHHLVRLLHLCYTTPVDLHPESTAAHALSLAYTSVYPDPSQDLPATVDQLSSFGLCSEDGQLLSQPFKDAGLLGFSLLITHLTSGKNDAPRVSVHAPSMLRVRRQRNQIQR